MDTALEIIRIATLFLATLKECLIELAKAAKDFSVSLLI